MRKSLNVISPYEDIGSQEDMKQKKHLRYFLVHLWSAALTKWQLKKDFGCLNSYLPSKWFRYKFICLFKLWLSFLLGTTLKLWLAKHSPVAMKTRANKKNSIPFKSLKFLPFGGSPFSPPHLCFCMISMMSLQVSIGTLYTLHLTHGQFHWTIKRKYKNFQEVHRDLYKHKMMLHLLPIGRLVCWSI